MNEERAMKAYKALRDMESATDLKKAGFTFTDVTGAEQTEFIVLEVNAYNERKDLMRPLSMEIWFKEAK